MNEQDPNQLTEQALESWRRKLALVETLLDEQISASERRSVRWNYQREQGVGDRTIRNYLHRYRKAGPLALLPRHGGPKSRSPRIHHEALGQRILALIDESPGRTVPQLRRIISREQTLREAIEAVSDRSIYRFLSEHELNQKQRAAKVTDGGRRSFHQFQASASMELVQGDARDGIWLPDAESGKVRKTYLFAWVDDYSRRILSARYFFDEKLPCMEHTFKTMVLRWGIPKKCYLDNGKVYTSSQFAFVLAELSIAKIHHRPYQSWCKGKIEAIMKTVKTEFQSEAALAGFRTLEELNSALWAWIDVEYHQRNHSTTGEPPADRFTAGMPADHRRVSDLASFEALFLQRAHRKVTKYGTVKLEGNVYRTAASAGSTVEIRYDPFDLRTVWRFEDRRRVETLEPRQLTHRIAVSIPEEQRRSRPEISEAAGAYFSALRERHTRIQSEANRPQYDKLIGESPE
jgi:putative transposase